MKTSKDPVPSLRKLLGRDVVLLPIKRGQKFPAIKNWQSTALAETRKPSYLKQLSKGNIGVLLGEPSCGLCSIDIDDDEQAQGFLSLNPNLNNTLQSRGARGRNIWVRIVGEFPKLTKLGWKDEKGQSHDWGEWRATGGQTVIYGRHPSGCDYQIVQNQKPIEIEFDSIVWPSHLELPWDFGVYEEVVQREGEPFELTEKGAVLLNQMFFVRKFAEERVILHEASEREFYVYDHSRGLWRKNTEESVRQRFSDDMKQYGDAQGNRYFERRRTDAFHRGLTSMLRGATEKSGVFQRQKRFIHAANGVLHLDVRPPELREFSPLYYSRNQCPIEVIEGAQCPLFKEQLLAVALDEDDIWLLQRYCGALLLGGNIAQRILVLTGTAGGGKSTLVEIIEAIIGLANVTELRTDHLGERFELFRYVGKTLLTGKDVPAEFLMRKSVSILKKLVGGDFLSAEGKNSNSCFDMHGEFNVIITSNSHLRVKLEGDADAWRRRLMMIDYKKPKPAKRISEFAKALLKEESSGILWWMVEGAVAHLNELNECGDFRLTKDQADRVERLLAESDSVREFVRQCVRPSAPTDSVTVEDMLSAYERFCSTYGWHPVPPIEAQRQFHQWMEEIHKIRRRNDIRTGEGVQRGFKGVQMIDTAL
jgi:P4 family phage/plasmid primase-like protien